MFFFPGWLSAHIRHRGGAFWFWCSADRAVSPRFRDLLPVIEPDWHFDPPPEAFDLSSQSFGAFAVDMFAPDFICHIFMSLIAMPNQSPEPTTIGAFRDSARVDGCWMSIVRGGSAPNVRQPGGAFLFLASFLKRGLLRWSDCPRAFAFLWPACALSFEILKHFFRQSGFHSSSPVLI